MLEIKTELIAEMIADLEESIIVGNTQHGMRVVAYVKGGTIKGPELNGEVLPGGGDWFLYRPDGEGELDCRVLIRTDEGEHIYMHYRGYLSIPPDLMMQIQQGEDVDPSGYYFRTAPYFEAGSEKLGWLNKTQAVAVGKFEPTRITYKIYAIR